MFSKWRGKETVIPERWDNGKTRLEAPKQRLLNSQSGLAEKELAWKKQGVGNVTEGFIWARQE